LMPFQRFVGLTSENCICLFAASSTRSEVSADFEWLIEQLYVMYGTLPGTWITDGDAKIYDSIETVAALHGIVVTLLLCVWHLFTNVQRQLTSKNVQFDPVALKAAFYKCRQCVTEAAFEESWALFVDTYGTSDAASTYLRNETYALREKWCLAWIHRAFHAFLMATSPSEAFHSLLASGDSAHRTPATLLKLVDRITTTQAQEHQKRCARWDITRRDLTLTSLPGLVIPSIVEALSSYAFNKLLERDLNSSRLIVSPTERSDVMYIGAWNAISVLYSTAQVHLVQQVDPSALVLSSRRKSQYADILGSLKRSGQCYPSSCLPRQLLTPD
jgi:hypothetical protein